MYEIKISDDLWKTIFTYLGTLSWPIIALIVACIFRNPIVNLIARIKTAKWKDLVLEFGDKVPVYSPEDKKFHPVILKPEPVTTFKPSEVKLVSRLSEDEIEQSKQKAQKRLEEDTKRVGYQRGKLYQLDNGKWAISWDVEISDGIILKG